ncbi:MAG: AbrB/MazE/SpoVT family DNA-binding domain-containing protein [Deltaproteobacteria bacterium]|nr:AbrB/MazE/SpoVT family DNA-binding domain-containing protein [Deltaproteobacteria bacterium]
MPVDRGAKVIYISYDWFLLAMLKKKKVLGKDVRTIMRVGGSLVISIPQEYIEAHGLEKGDKMTIFYDDILHVEPVTKEEILEKIRRIEEGKESGG